MIRAVGGRWRAIALVAALGGAGLLSGRLLSACQSPGDPSSAEERAGAEGLAAGATGEGPSGRAEARTPAVLFDDAGAGAPGAGSYAGRGPPPRIHRRPSDEWQGMLVDLTFRQVCSESSQCGLALACKMDGFCGPCASDAECAEGELCVLDHCLVEANVGCRSRTECATDELCILSGYTPVGRANGDMRSYCNPNQGGTEQVEDDGSAAEDWDPAAPLPVSPQVLLDSLR